MSSALPGDPSDPRSPTVPPAPGGDEWADAADDDCADDKDDLRGELLQQRRSLTPDHIERARQAVAAAVLARCRADGWRCVAAFVPLRTEPGSIELLDGLRRLGVEVLVPVTLTDRDLDWMPWPGERLLGKAAIGRADAVLVPALAVAADGTRLGRGGGSYDRALVRARADVPVAALLYDDEVRHHLPRAPWDVPVTVRVTPTGGWVPIG